jgi:inorganic phosphate transporter, PiT family
MILTFLAATALFLAFSNGANDNFKGFATVWGSASLSYRTALILSNVATLAGGVLSIILADGLIKQFSGRGLVSDAVAVSGPFALSVAGGAGITVALATRLGFPISTTHAIMGGLIGAALSSGESIAFGHLGMQFILPLLTSPIIAACLGFIAYKFAPKPNAKTDCICIVAAKPVAAGGALVNSMAMPETIIGSSADCPKHGTATGDAIARVSVSGVLDWAHIASAITICFARALNDTPKLAALLVGANVMSAWSSAFAVTAAMVIGGLLFSRRVAETMSLKLSDINPVQGTAAHLTTSIVVLTASKFSLPVSTTHVSVGSIIGSGKAANTLDLSTVRAVLLSWVVTLPVAIISAAVVMQVIRAL